MLNDLKYYNTSDWLGLCENNNNATRKDHCVWETRYRDTIVLGSHDKKNGRAFVWNENKQLETQN